MATTTAAAARKELANESFKDVELLIWDSVHRFHRRYGDHYGTREELFSEGCVAFTIAYRRYDPAKGSFPTYVRTVVGHTLLELVRTETKRRVRFNTTTEVEPSVSPPHFSLTDFLDEISEDARAIVSLVLDTPTGLLRVMQEDDRKQVKHTLRQYLDGMGWDTSRVTRAFSEISTALA